MDRLSHVEQSATGSRHLRKRNGCGRIVRFHENARRYVVTERKTVTLVYDSTDSLKCNTDIPNSFSVCLTQAFDANTNRAPGCVVIKAWANDATMAEEWHGRIVKLEATVEVEGHEPYVRPELGCLDKKKQPLGTGLCCVYCGVHLDAYQGFGVLHTAEGLACDRCIDKKRAREKEKQA